MPAPILALDKVSKRFGAIVIAEGVDLQLAEGEALGIKAGGEGGTTAAPAVMVSAILDALAELGVHDIAMPATPFTVWTAIQKAKAQ